MSVVCRETPLSLDERDTLLPVDSYNRALGGGALELTYVHQAAFAQTAIEGGTDYAYKICDGLSSLRMRRLAGHHMMAHVLIDNDSFEYGVQAGFVAQETNIIDGGDQDLRWLSHMYGVSEVGNTTQYFPILNPQNRLVNTCYDDGFYTLAQTQEASDWMYADDESFSSFLPKIARGEGPKFLTVVRGGEYATGEFDTPELAVIPARIALAETVYVKPGARGDGPTYATLPLPVGATLNSAELNDIELDSREFYLGLTLHRIGKRVEALRREASVARWLGDGAHAQTRETRADLLAGCASPLKKVFEMRHFSTRSLEG